MTRAFYFLLVTILMSIACKGITQDTINYPMHKTTFEVGVTAGLFVVFFTDLEVGGAFSRRISNRIVLEAKPVLGLSTQLLLFDGNTRYRIIRAGATLGVSYGKQNRFVEWTSGLAYFSNDRSSWDNNDKPIGNIVGPIGILGSIGYKKSGLNSTFRVGLGWPNGLYIGFNF